MKKNSKPIKTVVEVNEPEVDLIEWPVPDPEVPKWKIVNVVNQLVSVSIHGKLYQLKAKASITISANSEGDLGHDVVVKKRQRFIKVNKVIP